MQRSKVDFPIPPPKKTQLPGLFLYCLSFFIEVYSLIGESWEQRPFYAGVCMWDTQHFVNGKVPLITLLLLMIITIVMALSRADYCRFFFAQINVLVSSLLLSALPLLHSCPIWIVDSDCSLITLYLGVSSFEHVGPCFWMDIGRIASHLLCTLSQN